MASVSAVPLAGSRRPNAASVVNVINAATIGAPDADLNVALAFAGFPAEIEERTDALVSSVNLTVSVGVPVGDPVAE